MTRAIQGAFGIWIVGTIISCISSGVWIGAGFLGVVNALAGFHAEQFGVGGGLSVPTGITAYWDALVTVLTWSYPYLASAWALPVKAFLWIVSVGVVVGLIQMAIYVISALVGLARSILGH
jgi:hypothetical protein